MRRTAPQRRRTPALRLFATAALLAGALTAQHVPQRTLERAIDFATSQDDNLFSLVRSQDDIHGWEQGIAEIEAGDHRAGVERLHRLLQTESGGVVPVAPGRFLGLRLAVIMTLANLPPAAEQQYAALARTESGAPADLHTLSREQLRLLAEKFPAADVGLRARIRLGDLALDAGEGLAAACHFRAALDGTRLGSADERRVAARLQCAAMLIDPLAARADAAAGRLDDDGADVLTALPQPTAAPTWRALGGGADGRTPMRAPAGRPDTRWNEEVIAPGFDRRDSGQLAMFPVGDLDGIFVNTGREVIAIDPLRGKVQWVSYSPMRDLQTKRWSGHGDAEGINQDMALAAACNDEVVVAALQVPETSRTVDIHAGFRVMSKIPMRRLFAFSRQTGKALWAHYDEIDGARTKRFRGHDVCASPLTAGDTVFVPVHDRSGAIAYSIGAYDVRTGQPQWKRLVCSSQQDVNMFGNARTEFAASPLALCNGVIHGASNLGVAFALDAGTGRLRWVTSYDVVVMPRARLQDQADRQVYFANNAPVVAGGAVCTTPLDSQFVLAHDAENGRLLWRLPAEATLDGVDNRVVWLAGAFGDEFVLTGAGALAVKARPDAGAGGRAVARQLARPEPGDRRSILMPGRPAVTADGVWFPRSDHLAAIDRDGQPRPREEHVPMGRYIPGNLLLIGGIIVSLRHRDGIHVAYDAAALLQHVQKQVEEAPDDPVALLRLATMQQALLPDPPTATALDAVRALYQRGLDACVRAGLSKQHPVRIALQQELFTQARAVARGALQRNAPDAMQHVVAARDVAPDVQAWVEMQALVFALCEDDAQRYAEELTRLEANAADAAFPYEVGGVPVPAWVAWQRARIAATPTDAVARWQDLLERHGDVQLGEHTAAELAQDAMRQLILEHGAACYAAVAARADEALAAAGPDVQALAAVARRFPNSAAAAKARATLLDDAVRSGNLAVACGALAEGLRTGMVPPGVARRVVVAATRAGNHGLAAAMVERLRAHGGERSDWPDDGGATYAEALRTFAPPPAAPVPLQLPLADVARIAPRSAREFMRLLPSHRGAGFATAGDTPLFAHADNQLLAIDVHAAGPRKPTLFAVPVAYLEQVIVCGTIVVVPDMERVFAIDHRTGEVRWELPDLPGRTFENLGLQNGVLHVFAAPGTGSGNGEFLGIEPLTGAVLFSHAQTAGATTPKAVPGSLLRLTVAAETGAKIESLDPLDGRPARTIDVAAEVLRSHLQLDADVLSTRLYPQGVCSDGVRVFLPVEGQSPGDAPSLLAIGPDGNIVWQWRGNAGRELRLAALRGQHVVVGDWSEQHPARVVVLDAATGNVQREVVVGHDAQVLNWERAWLPNEAPRTLAISSFADAERRQRQLVCVGTDHDSAFVVTLGPEDGEVVRAPRFGDDFVAFGVRPARGSAGFRLYALSLRDRSGVLPDGAKYRRIDGPGTGDAMTVVGPHIVISGAQGFLLLGTPEAGK